MGFLNLFSRPGSTTPVRLPSGSFTIDSTGHILASTLPQQCPLPWTNEIGRQVLATFRAAEAAEVPLQEIVADYTGLKLTARALRGGAIIFIAPQGGLTRQ